MPDYAAELAELMPENTTLPRQGVGINVKRLVKLRTRLMILTFLGIAVPALLAIWVLVPREFVASASVEFKGQTMGIMTDQRGLVGPNYDNYVNTQIQLINGPTILKRVLADPAISNLPSIRRQGDNALVHLMANTDAVAERRTELVTLTFSDTNRDAAIIVLDKVLEEYKAYTEEEELNQGGLRRRTLSENLVQLTEDLERQRSAIEDLRRELEVPIGNTPGLEPTETESYRVNLAQAEADLTTAQTRKRQTERLIERISDFLEQNRKSPAVPIYAMGIEDKVSEDVNVVLLTEQLAVLQQDFAGLQETYVEGAPQLKVKTAERDGLLAKLHSVESGARAEALQSLFAQYEYELEVVESDIDDAEQRRDKFVTLLEEYRQHNLELSQGLAKIDDMEDNYRDRREYRRQLENQLLTVEIESNAPARVNVLGSATAPSDPDMGRRLKFILVALFGALSFSIGLGILLELTDQGIRSAEDLSFVTRHPILASIPHTAEDRIPSNASPPQVTAQYPGSMTADEFRRAAALLLNPPHHGPEVKTCMIASPARGDGKSTLACNLAITLAQAGRRVLLVDCDSRSPSIESCFGLQPGPGLADLLGGGQLAHDPDRATDFEDLYVMGPGLRSSDLVERLASRDVIDFIDGAREVFDHVIVDTPASLLMSEARLMAASVDGVVVVVGAGISSFGMVRRCIRSIEEIGGSIVGVVVNGLHQTPGGYLRQNLDQYYANNVGHRSETGASSPPSAEPSILLTRDKADGQGEG